MVTIRDRLALVFAAGLWASCYPLITIGLSFAPAFSFAALRALLAGGALALLALVLGRPMPRGGRNWLALVAIGFETTSLGFFGMFHAAEFVSPGLATVIANSQPLIAAILAYFLLGENLGTAQRLGLLVGFVGIVLLSLPQLGGAGRSDFLRGLADIILAAGGVAGGNVLMKAVCGRIDPLVAMAAQYLFGAVPLGIAALLFERPSAIHWSPAFIASLLGLALVGSALVYWLWFTLLGRIPLSRANAFTLLTPFIGYALGIAFFGERPGLFSPVGLALTVGGIVLVERGTGSHLANQAARSRSR